MIENQFQLLIQQPGSQNKDEVQDCSKSKYNGSKVSLWEMRRQKAMALPTL